MFFVPVLSVAIHDTLDETHLQSTFLFCQQIVIFFCDPISYT